MANEAHFLPRNAIAFVGLNFALLALPLFAGPGLDGDRLNGPGGDRLNGLGGAFGHHFADLRDKTEAEYSGNSQHNQRWRKLV